MLTFAVAPLFLSYFFWYQRHLSLKIIDRNLELLQRLKQLCRSSTAIPRSECGVSIAQVVSESVDMGLSCSASLTQSSIWLRLFKIQSLKAHKLTCMWMVRLFAVIGISLVVRWYLLGSVETTFSGISTSDRYLMLLSGSSVLMSTAMFFKLVPRVTTLGGYEVEGLSAWLRDRIYIESGLHITSSTEKILKLQSSEDVTGIGLVNEKIDALDDVWRSRIDLVEKEAETASEVMPFLELVFFGLFILCILLEPSLKFAS